VPYILEVQAVNGVSELSPDPPQAAAINVSTSHAVPSAVPALHQVSRASNSITVSWPQPDQTNGNILDYQLRYYDQAEDESHSFTLTSETNTATVTQLSPGHIYGFQVRARTAAGHGPYGGKVYFQTLPQGELSTQLPERLSLVIGSILGALAFLLLAAITVLAVVFQRKRRGTGYTEQLQQSSSPGLGVKYYIDPSTYEDPCQAIREFTREVDPAYIKIEEVIGAGSFGEVRRGRLQPRGRREQAVAIQALWAGGAESLQMTFLGQAAVLGQFQHPNILRLEGVVTKSRPLMVLTELMELGPLDSFLRVSAGLGADGGALGPGASAVLNCPGDRRQSPASVLPHLRWSSAFLPRPFSDCLSRSPSPADGHGAVCAGSPPGCWRLTSAPRPPAAAGGPVQQPAAGGHAAGSSGRHAAPVQLRLRAPRALCPQRAGE